MTRRTFPLLVLTCALTLLAPSAGSTQIVTLPADRDPAWWIAAGVGWVQMQGRISDGRTGTSWDFADGMQLQGAVEYGLRNTSGIGISVSYARLPLVYSAEMGTFPSGLNCSLGCDATATVYSVLAMFHAGGGQGLHQILQIVAGVNGYSDFTLDADGSELEPSGGDRDLAFGVSYGFGYSVGPRLHIGLVQNGIQVIHQGEGLGAGGSRTSFQTTTRLTVRYGIGARKPR